MTQADRIAKVAPALRVLVKQYKDGSFPEGSEAMNDKMTKLIQEAKLSELRNVSVDRMGCFPGNRFGAGLVPVDVHYVLSEGFGKNGWNPRKWECMCLTIPEALKDEWTSYNHELVKQSQGLLPEICDVELVTGRGSHGTAALRAIKFGCQAIDPAVADEQGRVSAAKVVEKQPSLKAPLDDGVMVTVMPGELELACPGLFSVLSEIGNVSNSVYRLNTALQSAVRIHQIATHYGLDSDPDWDVISKQASRGMPQREIEKLPELCKFVQEWAGGADCHILKDLEAYEKSLQTRRKLRFEDLGKLASCSLQDLPCIVPVTRLKRNMLHVCFNVI